MRSIGLEKYKGSNSRFTCPSCGHKKEFARYIYLDTGKYIDESVGKCNRIDSCQYHRTPREHFEMFMFTKSSAEHVNRRHTMNNVNAVNIVNTLNNVNRVKAYEPREYQNSAEQKGSIDKSYLIKSFTHTGSNRFLNFLISIIDEEIVEDAVKNYFIGTTKTGETIFWLIDKEDVIRGGKIIDYDERTGKRNKDKYANSIVAKLKKAGVLPQSFVQFSCLFGEHLLKTDREKIVAVVEAEKSAFVASMFLPKFLWVAVGSKDWINNMERMAPLKKRNIVLFPDLGAFDTWKNFELIARKQGFQVSTSTLLEDCATEDQRREKWDLADYLITNQAQAVANNKYADTYNKQVDKVLTDPLLMEYFDGLYTERQAITETDVLPMEEVRRLVAYAACNKLKRGNNYENQTTETDRPN